MRTASLLPGSPAQMQRSAASCLAPILQPDQRGLRADVLGGGGIRVGNEVARAGPAVQVSRT